MYSRPVSHFFRLPAILVFGLVLLPVTGSVSLAQAQDPDDSSIQAEPGTERYQRLKARRAAQQKGEAESGKTAASVPAARAISGKNGRSNEGLIIPVDSTRQDSLLSNDDGSTDAIPLGFDFVFYGENRTSVYINNNGNLSFDKAINTFTPDSFPLTDTSMVAPFWADVETSPEESGIVYYRVYSDADRMVVTWDSVGYYNDNTDKLNTFQVILSTKEDPVTTVGKNVCLAYGDMEWTTGDASNGENGFGGAPATAGVNKGDGESYALVGRFDEDGDDYDGPGGQNDGVDYLDGQQFCFDVSRSTNVPPLASDVPDEDTLEVFPGLTLRDTVRFTAPEETQTVSSSVSHDIPNFTTTTTDGNPAEIAFAFSPTTAQAGQTYQAILSGTDDGDPVETTAETLYVEAKSLPTATLDNPDALPTPGTNASIDVGLPSDVSVTDGTLFYRSAGATSFQSASRDLSGIEDGGTASFSIPGSAVTESGVQYYAQLRVPLPEREGAFQFTVPAGAPDTTGFLATQVEQTAAEGRFQPDTYRMLSVPVALDERTVFEVLEGAYGSYDPQEWKVARWAPSESAYRFGSEINSLRAGEAVWLITAGGDSLTVNDVRSTDASSPQPIPLEPGWNQIGTPFPFPVAWNDVQRPEPVRDPFAYDPPDFQDDVSVLAPWQGYFVYNRADTAVTLQVPPEPAASEGGQGTSLAKAGGTDGYRLHATASLHRDGKRLQDRATWVGFAEGADPGFGPKDRARPPSVGAGVRLHVTPEEGPALARSLKPRTPDGAAWNLRVTAHLDEPLRSPQEVTITFDERGHRPSGFRRYVVDRDEDRRLPVANRSVTVQLTPDRPTRRLRVIVGTEAFARETSEGASLAIEETKLRTNAPNPFAESTTIPYQLAERGPVTIAIYDLLGRRVETLVDGTQKAGVHEVEWRPGPERDRTLASGVYFCRMTAGAYTATRKLILVR